jgi:hypothetical protein
MRCENDAMSTLLSAQAPGRVPDPRSWPSWPGGQPWAAMQAAIDAPTGDEAEVQDVAARAWLRARIDAGDRLSRVFAQAPSYALARHLLRLVADVEATYGDVGVLRPVLFAMPLVLVAALDADGDAVVLPAVLPDAISLAERLRAARTFGRCETFALAASLVTPHAIDVDALPALLARTRLAQPPGAEVPFGAIVDLPPSPIRVDERDERVHLRFIVGAVLAPPNVDPLAGSTFGKAGIDIARAIGEALKAPGVSLLALPKPPLRLALAVPAGRAAQREVSAQLFVSNAIRAVRSSYGEPTAIVSAHRAPDAPDGGELRLSLSSPFAPRAAQGFRCPIYPTESVGDVLAALETLLGDCHVGDVRVLAGVHPDVDAATGQPLFFKNLGDDTALH